MNEKERIVDSLATENQMLQEPKTPTQEQIEKIMHNQKDELECGNCSSCYVQNECFHAIKIIITEWEKIRNQNLSN